MTLMTRWIVPYSEQFKFIVLSHCPFLPRNVRCWLMESWLSGVYRKAGLQHMAPPKTTPQLFTGQCNDAFFQYARQASLLVEELLNASAFHIR